MIMRNFDTDSISSRKIFQKVITILTPLIAPARQTDQIRKKTHLINDLGLDSVGILHLILAVEKAFDISIKNHELDLEVLSELGNLIELIEGKIKIKDQDHVEELTIRKGIVEVLADTVTILIHK